MLSTLLTAASVVVLAAGLLLATVGLYGLLRMPDTYHRLHAAGLITGPATVLVLLASIGSGNVAIITSAVLVIVFVLVTSPLSSHAVAQAAYLRGARDGTPGGDAAPVDD
jgi:monovalent cation/proton antiporter MnhG/PhaG subunit